MDEPRQHPIGDQMPRAVSGLARRLGLASLEDRFGKVAVQGTFAMVNGFISIAVMAAAAFVTGQPLVFPSLGPTAFLLFYSPLAAAASPRNTVLGHLVGVLAGYVALVLCGLTTAGSAMQEGIGVHRILAAALSLGLTSGVTVWLHVPHPPAGATTLIVSLGIITRPEHLAVLMLAVVLLVGQAIVIDRLSGIGYPLWAPRRPPRSARDG